MLYSKERLKLSRYVYPPFEFFHVSTCKLWIDSNNKQALLEGNADPDHGSPSAMRAVELFKQEEKWAKKFEEAPGRGKAV